MAPLAFQSTGSHNSHTSSAAIGQADEHQRLKTHLHQQLVVHVYQAVIATIDQSTLHAEMHRVLEELCQHNRSSLGHDDRQRLVSEVLAEAFSREPEQPPPLQEQGQHLLYIVPSLVAHLGRHVYETPPLETMREAEEYLDWLEANGYQELELFLQDGKGFVIRCQAPWQLPNGKSGVSG